MLKTLVRKQFKELFNFYFYNKKKGQKRTTVSTVLMFVLYAFLLVYVGGLFYFVSSSMVKPFHLLNLDWLYFAICGILSVFLGVFGSVFNTYAGLYHAKDNEFLLSMPVPPSKILYARLINVALLSLLFESVVYIPALIAYYVNAKQTVLSVITSFLTMFLLLFVIIALTCGLGFVIAYIAGKLKNKSIVTVLIALAFFAGYYYLCFNYYSAIQNLIANAQVFSVSFKSYAYPIYVIGKGASGNILYFLISLAFCFALLFITFLILSKTFIKIVTTNKGDTVKKVYKESKIKVSNANSALMKKEFKHFLSSPTYMLNCGLGSVFMLIISVVAVVFKNDIGYMIQLLPFKKEVFIIIVATVCGMLSSMNYITAPSISLEGNNINILKSLPVSANKVFEAKLNLHYCITLPFAVIMSVVLSVVTGFGFVTTVFITVVSIEFVLFSASAGLALNLKFPNLTWTNETIPIKQSLSVIICLFGGWALAGVVCVGGIFATKIVDSADYLLFIIVVLALLTRFINGWIKGKGTRIFAEL